jgi:hypothetical protein
VGQCTEFIEGLAAPSLCFDFSLQFPKRTDEVTRGAPDMTNLISASLNSANAVKPSFVVPPRTTTTSYPSTQKAAQNNEDTVELSTTAQRYLTGSSSAQGIVADLVKEAAAGDQGALSLLTVI